MSKINVQKYVHTYVSGIKILKPFDVFKFLTKFNKNLQNFIHEFYMYRYTYM